MFKTNKLRFVLLGLLAASSVGEASSQNNPSQFPTQKLKVMTYNVENLFDTTLDFPAHDDREFTPQGEQNWRQGVLLDKIQNLKEVIISENPDVLALQEVESEKAFLDLFYELRQFGYVDTAIAPSTDKRGIRCAVISKLPIEAVQVHDLNSSDRAQDRRQNGRYQDNRQGALPFKVREILEVEFRASRQGPPVSLLCNHWPARMNNDSALPTRKKVAEKMQDIVASILRKNPEKSVLSVGDFNEDLGDESISQLKQVKTMKELLSNGREERLFAVNRELEFSKPEQRGTHYFQSWVTYDHIFLALGEKAKLAKNPSLHYISGSAKAVKSRFVYKNGAPKGCTMPRESLYSCDNGASDHRPMRAIFEIK